MRCEIPLSAVNFTFHISAQIPASSLSKEIAQNERSQSTSDGRCEWEAYRWRAKVAKCHWEDLFYSQKWSFTQLLLERGKCILQCILGWSFHCSLANLSLSLPLTIPVSSDADVHADAFMPLLLFFLLPSPKWKDNYAQGVDLVWRLISSSLLTAYLLHSLVSLMSRKFVSMHQQITRWLKFLPMDTAVLMAKESTWVSFHLFSLSSRSSLFLLAKLGLSSKWCSRFIGVRVWSNHRSKGYIDMSLVSRSLSLFPLDTWLQWWKKENEEEEEEGEEGEEEKEKEGRRMRMKRRREEKQIYT